MQLPVPVSHLLLSRRGPSPTAPVHPICRDVRGQGAGGRGQGAGGRGQEAGPPSAHRAATSIRTLGRLPRYARAITPGPAPSPGDRSRVLHSRVTSGLLTGTRAVGVSSGLPFTRHTAWRCTRVSACVNSSSPSFLGTELSSPFGVCLSVTDFYAPTSLPFVEVCFMAQDTYGLSWHVPGQL